MTATSRARPLRRVPPETRRHTASAYGATASGLVGLRAGLGSALAAEAWWRRRWQGWQEATRGADLVAGCDADRCHVTGLPLACSAYLGVSLPGSEQRNAILGGPRGRISAELHTGDPDE